MRLITLSNTRPSIPWVHLTSSLKSTTQLSAISAMNVPEDQPAKLTGDASCDARDLCEFCDPRDGWLDKLTPLRRPALLPPGSRSSSSSTPRTLSPLPPFRVFSPRSLPPKLLLLRRVSTAMAPDGASETCWGRGGGDGSVCAGSRFCPGSAVHTIKVDFRRWKAPLRLADHRASKCQLQSCWPIPRVRPYHDATAMPQLLQVSAAVSK